MPIEPVALGVHHTTIGHQVVANDGPHALVGAVPLQELLCEPEETRGGDDIILEDQPFGFMALLGLLSLSGMLIKNAIVLIDQIDLEIRSGKDRYQSVVDSGVSRLNPVMMAAATTILGMIPLLQDAFFVSMAVTIMFGLLVATVLTLVVVPVLYTIFFKIPNPSK